MAEIEFTRRALDDLVRLRGWLAWQNPSAAERAIKTITEKFDLLTDFPLLGPQVGDSGIREMAIPFGRYGYVARYSVRGDRVIVSRLFHVRERR